MGSTNSVMDLIMSDAASVFATVSQMINILVPEWKHTGRAT